MSAVPSFCELALAELHSSPSLALLIDEQKMKREALLSKGEKRALLAGMSHGSAHLAFSVDALLEEKQQAKALRGLLSTLPLREERILRARFGIGCDERTLSELGREYGLSRSSIESLEKRSLVKLRKRFNS